jgi:hypothetical protein
MIMLLTLFRTRSTMAVITIPSDQDPRVPSFHCVDGPYIFDAANFPPTLGLKDEKHDSDHVANDEKSRSWAGVVEFGPLRLSSLVSVVPK